MRPLRLWLGLAISAACLVLAFRGVDLAATVALMARADYAWLLPALAVYFLGVWLRAVRWHYLLQPVKAVPSGRLFPIVVIGYMANDVLPARMGEVVRAYLFGRKEAVSASSALATIAVERIFDGIAMLSFMASVAAVAPFPEDLRRIAGVAAVVFVALSGLLLLAAFYSEGGARAVGIVLAFLPGRFAARATDVAASFFAGLHALRSLRLLAAIYLYSLLAWLAEALVYYLIGLGFGLPIPTYAYLLTVSAANLATLVPSSPGYVGPFDAAAIFVLTLFGSSRDAAASYTLVLHAALIIPVVLLGFFYLWRDHLTLEDVSGRPAGGRGQATPT